MRGDTAEMRWGCRAAVANFSSPVVAPRFGAAVVAGRRLAPPLRLHRPPPLSGRSPATGGREAVVNGGRRLSRRATSRKAGAACSRPVRPGESFDGPGGRRTAIPERLGPPRRSERRSARPRPSRVSCRPCEDGSSGAILHGSRRQPSAEGAARPRRRRDAPGPRGGGPDHCAATDIPAMARRCIGVIAMPSLSNSRASSVLTARRTTSPIRADVLPAAFTVTRWPSPTST